MDLMKRLIKGEEGQGLVEYALIVGLVALAVVAATTAVGTSINGLWAKISGQLNKIKVG